MANLQKDSLNAIKMMSIDMIDEAKSGHPGITLGASPILYALYLNCLNTFSSNPKWINRDRFILSCGHASSLLYSMLYFAGYDLSLDDLKRYRDIDSFTPGHPELNTDIGVECTTGVLGEGIAHAVGIATAERYYENLCNTVNKKSNLINYYTYVLASDGDLQEGISYEALSFASTQKLNKLIIILDSNKVQLDGDTKSSFTEEIEDRFDALDFNVIDVKNGSSVADITSAIKSAKKADMPSIIIVHTTIGKDSKWEGSNKCHGVPLEEDDIKNLKTKYKLPLDKFSYDEKLRDYVKSVIFERVNKKYTTWQKEYNLMKETHNEFIVNMLRLLENDEFNIDFDSTNYQINENYEEEGRISNYKVMNFIAPKTRFFLGGSNDLSLSTNTIIDKSRNMSAENPNGRNIAFGVRENASGAISSGMALCGLRTFTSTFLAFADNLKPSMKLSAQMNLPVTYIFTHDGVGNSKDGATHQGFENLTMLRSIPNMVTFRPADINEIIGAWEYILKNRGTSSLVLTKEKRHILKHTNGKYVKYGAYIVRKEKYHLDAIVIATGSEVATALKVAEELFEDGIDLRVVSMPCIELFLKQNPVYEEKLLPDTAKIITLEAGSTLLWHRFASNKNNVIGIDTFGSSGKKDDVLKFLGFDYNQILIKIKKIVESD